MGSLLSLQTGVAVVLLLSSFCASASPLYKYIDENGQPAFTHSPPAGQSATSIQTTPINSMPATQATTTRQTITRTAEKPVEPLLVYQQLRITSPAADSSFLANDRSLQLSVHSEPTLQSGHVYQLLLDGQAHGPTSHSNSWRVTDIDRGSHQLQVRILDSQGLPLFESASIDFHLRQTTLADRQRTQPCQLEDYGKRHECPLADKPQKRSWWRLAL